MKNKFDINDNIDIAWCPGCGNFLIRKEIMSVLEEENISPQELVLVSGIGQAAKMPQYINSNFFNGLHGRGLPVATAIKASNPQLKVLAFGGDGDMYGEGGNHLLHASRRNPDITLFVHDNMIYGLTKGQASPTTNYGIETPVQTFGVFERPLNPISLAISLEITFVARIFCGHIEESKQIIKQAINHKGFALIDIFQPCVSFNKVNTHKWFEENTYYLKNDYDPSDRDKAFKKAYETMPFPLGIIYKNEGRKTFEDNIPIYKDNSSPLITRASNKSKVRDELNKKI